MDKSVKIALIGFLIVAAYATSLFLDTGFWIVPFPLFSYLLLGVVIISIVQNKVDFKAYIPILTLITLRCIGNPFTYTFFMEEATYYEFTEGITLSLFRILETLSVFPLIVLTLGFKETQQKLTALVLSAIYIVTLIPSLDLLNYVFFTGFVITLIYRRNTHSTLPILILLAVFDILEGYSVLFA